jgi:hypothetical protein
MGYRVVYLGRLERFNLTNDTTPPAYGNIGYRAFNMTEWEFSGTMGIMSVSGMRCLLYREQGLVNSTRLPGNESSISTWTIDTAQFSTDQEKVVVPSLLSKFQWSNLNFHAPGSVVPGLGPALNKIYSEKVDEWGAKADDPFTNFALNYLYTSGETQRILYEVAASSKNTSRRLPQYTINVPAFAMQQQYRITYVPSILLMGLLCLLGASAVTGAMVVHARKSFSVRAHRQVNVVRLLLDSVIGLEADVDKLEKVAQGGNDELDTWAAGYKVKYTSMGEYQGTVRIILENIQG